jgi:hypothetical protein
MLDRTAPSELESAVARARRLLALLRELSEAGMKLVHELSRELHDGALPADIEIRYCRLAKAIRQLIALEARLGQALDDVAAGRWEAEDAERSLRALSAQARKDAAFGAVEQAIREAGDGEAFQRLSERLDDWYSERSVERDFTDKSVAEIVTGACKLIGIAPDPALLTDEAMSQTLADAVRAYAAALKAAWQPSSSLAGAHNAEHQPAERRSNAIAEARPPPA